MILTLLPESKRRTLPPDELRMYELLERYWGRVHRHAMYQILGLRHMDADDRQSALLRLARGLGDQITDLAIISTHYLSTWPAPPKLSPKLTDAHQSLGDLVPLMYRAAALLMADGPLARNKEFGDAAIVYERLNRIACTLLEKRTFIATEERLAWVSELYQGVRRLSMTLDAIIGVSDTKSLLPRC